ncbi:hypothetical protein ES703_119098 [subsurface metagenome]
MLLLCTELNQGFALVDWREQTSVQAHRDTFSRESNLYDLGKIKTPLSRDFYQASSEVQRFWRKRINKHLSRKLYKINIPHSVDEKVRT